jgi:hypothetical protein
VYIDRCLVELRRRLRKVEREHGIWAGRTPFGGVAYYDSLCDCMLFKLCPCFMQFTEWKISSQGVRRRLLPPSCNVCCKPMHNDFSDFRFLKDVDWWVVSLSFHSFIHSFVVCLFVCSSPQRMNTRKIHFSYSCGCIHMCLCVAVRVCGRCTYCT